jgi:hypothetical protein
MSEYPDLSRLPEDPAYWNDLESRVLAGLHTGEAVEVIEQDGWLAPLATRALAIGGLAAAAAIAAILLLPARSPAPLAVGGLLRMPDDPIVAAFVAAEAPPALTSLLLGSGERPR